MCSLNLSTEIDIYSALDRIHKEQIRQQQNAKKIALNANKQQSEQAASDQTIKELREKVIKSKKELDELIKANAAREENKSISSQETSIAHLAKLQPLFHQNEQIHEESARYSKMLKNLRLETKELKKNLIHIQNQKRLLKLNEEAMQRAESMQQISSKQFETLRKLNAEQSAKAKKMNSENEQRERALMEKIERLRLLNKEQRNMMEFNKRIIEGSDF